DSRVGLSWDPATSTYKVSQNGGLTNGAAPATVIIQMVNVHSSGFVDVHKMPTPRTISTGGGKVVVLRGGARIAGTWKRNGYGATHYLDATGKDITMAAGPVWVLLLPTTGSVTFS
ncbi:MAG: hypothetical protein JWR41_1406, partial [Modestobacter sp.]|nr:hypothetical protein [Modestobacter sp.]